MIAPPHPAPRRTVAIVGAGPAGLAAAERLAMAGHAVTVYDRMPSAGRKFLMAGRGGLNLTHSEPLDAFLGRYGAARGWLEPMIAAFPPDALRAWADGLGAETFVGSSGRVFPKAMKASPLLRAWLARLGGLGVGIATRRTFLGWDETGALLFRGPDGTTEAVAADATLLALGGASWPRLGSDGGWAPLLAERGVAIARLRPANAGVRIDWSTTFAERFAGAPVKSAAFLHVGRRLRGEAVVTATGLEGGTIYTLFPALRDAVETGRTATLTLDLAPDLPLETLVTRLAARPAAESLSNRLRKAAHLAPVSVGLLREAAGNTPPKSADALAALVKAAPFRLTGVAPIERAISTAGGIAREAVDGRLMLTALPGTFVAGEMLDWEAPTGGYLLQASFASGLWAAEGIIARLGAG
ncbi:TIGR03862 family flavoprotein [Prosthecomicrobium pneumaticum]|uniref:NAD(FAD)-utilizing dehydrogenase n=1 Tax=Prosthecomicrobium pneumaticum TaxID=81895 RepID=A0A7W9FP05_9HYPH|nr:TIGR03862 family flavoprotein [Prosthecomicrobium pneumaticum]MBB5754213.1 hypothetical protein [Prosthecomicrobium pneumaticum]